MLTARGQLALIKGQLQMKGFCLAEQVMQGCNGLVWRRCSAEQVSGHVVACRVLVRQ